MSITNRLSIFFLAALGVVLAGFSGALYGLASWHLHTQTDRHLATAMHALIAAIEVHPMDVEWEPLERKLPIGLDPDLSVVRWSLHDENGQLVDCSPNITPAELEKLHSPDPDWRVLVRRLRAGMFEPEVLSLKDLSPDMTLAGELPTDRTALRQSFLLTVGLSEKPDVATLQNLAMNMGGLSLLIWCGAGVAAHWLCRRALMPITKMADEARSLSKTPEAQTLLHVPATRDEVADLGQAYNDLLTALRLTLEQQRRFAGDASHQLRTPLAAILTAVEVTLRHERSRSEYETALSAVLRRGRELQGIVEALLLLTRLESSAAIPDQDVIDVGAWSQHRLETWSTHPRFADIRLTAAADIGTITTQPLLLAQIFDNLLDNALKYSEPGSRVTVAVKRVDRRVSLSVTDCGPGIAAAEVNEIFAPFYRSRDSRWQGKPGVGLGLTIAHRLSMALGGKLEVHSEPGNGSCFTLSLPTQNGLDATHEEGSQSCPEPLASLTVS
ncbi:sensor histidine kinase [Anatilimnocola floriformis]|uniref:sensor histidine kinase n=1 Tax=Anatilimnocola floriformis TaxID=2948575 RepID=UPI0020C40D56|nr:HAMP domain-containing sensor histidine kinase [Anatilimnocola floriformis]